MPLSVLAVAGVKNVVNYPETIAKNSKDTRSSRWTHTGTVL